jgi:hypothetical protein
MTAHDSFLWNRSNPNDELPRVVSSSAEVEHNRSPKEVRSCPRTASRIGVERRDKRDNVAIRLVARESLLIRKSVLCAWAPVMSSDR